jgi:D-serine deaminase-like pyridoxal phosphate-dependent protein
MRLSSFPTPQVVVFAPRLEANIATMQAAVAAGGKRLRPHAKTHKSPAIARMQVARGAVGICCAKLGEAEVFADAGIGDIRLPYPVNTANASRVLALLDKTALSIIVDHPDVASEWSRRMAAAGRTLDVLVKVDVGFHRCGIDPADQGAAAFVERVAALPGLRFRGLLSHAGHGYHAGSEAELEAVASTERDLMVGLAEAVRSRGVAVDEVSVGATPTARFSARLPGITEMRPGNYVYLDRTQAGLGAARLSDCALFVTATVVSTPAPDRVILDCGSKTLSSDQARGFAAAPGHGLVFRSGDDAPDPGLVIERLSEEHATVRVRSGAARPPLEPGDRVLVLPNHSCVVSNLVDEVLLVDGDNVLERLPVAARGKIQ